MSGRMRGGRLSRWRVPAEISQAPLHEHRAALRTHEAEEASGHGRSRRPGSGLPSLSAGTLKCVKRNARTRAAVRCENGRKRRMCRTTRAEPQRVVRIQVLARTHYSGRPLPKAEEISVRLRRPRSSDHAGEPNPSCSVLLANWLWVCNPVGILCRRQSIWCRCCPGPNHRRHAFQM